MPSSLPLNGDPPPARFRLANVWHSRFSLQTLANGLVGFGTSAALAKGMGDFAEPTVPAGDSIFALLLGSTLSVIAIFALKRHLRLLSDWLRSAGALTGAAGLTAGGLYLLFAGLSENGRLSIPSGWVFFVVLCVYFAVAFVSRTCRIEVAARHAQEVGFVEAGYAIGCAAGLIAWQASQSLGMQSALLINLPVMAAAAACDYRSSRLTAGARTAQSGSRHLRDRRIAYAGVGFLVGMTVLVQISTQHLSKTANNLYLLAAFDVGTVIGSLLAGSLGLHLLVSESGRSKLASGIIRPAVTWRPAEGTSVILVAGATFAAILAVSVVAWQRYDLPWLQLALVLLAAAMFEAAAIVIVDWFGKYVNLGGLSAVAYGLMSVVGAVVYCTLLYSGGGYNGCLACVLISGGFSIATLLIATNMGEPETPATVPELVPPATS